MSQKIIIVLCISISSISSTFAQEITGSGSITIDNKPAKITSPVLNINDNFHIGYNDFGKLSIINGGVVNIKDSNTVVGNDGEGVLIIDGDESLYNSNYYIYRL